MSFSCQFLQKFHGRLSLQKEKTIVKLLHRLPDEDGRIKRGRIWNYYKHISFKKIGEGKLYTVAS